MIDSTPVILSHGIDDSRRIAGITHVSHRIVTTRHIPLGGVRAEFEPTRVRVVPAVSKIGASAAVAILRHRGKRLPDRGGFWGGNAHADGPGKLLSPRRIGLEVGVFGLLGVEKTKSVLQLMPKPQKCLTLYLAQLSIQRTKFPFFSALDYLSGIQGRLIL